MTIATNTARGPVAVATAAAIALGGLFALGATAPANAMPLSMNQLALKEAAPDNVIDVRRRHRRGHAAAGIALGILGAAAAAHAYDRHHRRHYNPHYYAPAPYPHYGYYGYQGRGCVMLRSHDHRSSRRSWHCR